MNVIRYHCDPFPSNTTLGTVGSTVGKSPQCHSGSNMKPFDIFNGSQHSLKQTNSHSFTSYLLTQRSNAPVRGEDAAPPSYLRGKADTLPFPLVCTNQDVSDVPPPPWSPPSLEGQHTATSASSPALLAAFPGLYQHQCSTFIYTHPLSDSKSC